MAGTVKANIVQLGDSLTATQNFSLQTNVDGTGKLARGNAGATTQDILTIDSNGRIDFPQGRAAPANVSMVRVNTNNGYGSTNTKIRRFNNIVSNLGTDITYADSASLGGSFTINTAGIYTISYSDQFSTDEHMGLSLNASSPTTALIAAPIAEILIVGTTRNAGYGAAVAWTGYLAASSVIRAHTSGTSSGVNPTIAQFTITRVA